METDANPRVFDLHQNCQGGKHYFGGLGDDKFIIFADNTYRRVTDLSTDSDARHWRLHPNCQGKKLSINSPSDLNECVNGLF